MKAYFIPINVFTVPGVLFMLFLVPYHFYMKSRCETTFERAKQTYTFRRVSPFETYSLVNNLVSSICVKKPKRPIYRPRENAYRDNFEHVL